MLTYSFDLIVRKHGEGDEPFTPEVFIYVKNYAPNDRGLVLLTHECATMEELEAEIDRLHTELEVLRTLARREFSKI